jgi:polar amino acid transport system substrate-binding protein
VFPFPVIGSGDIAASLRKVDAGRIDGYVFDAYSTDEQLAAGGFKNIHRKLYSWIDVCFVLPKGSKGGPLDHALGKMTENAKNSQGYKDAIAKYNALFKGEDWQQ